MILSSVSETLLRILTKINVGIISDFLFQCSLVLLGLLQFISTVFLKTKTTKQFHLRRVEKEEQKKIKLAGEEYHLCVVVIKYVKTKRRKPNFFSLIFFFLLGVSCLKVYFCLPPEDH